MAKTERYGHSGPRPAIMANELMMLFLPLLLNCCTGKASNPGSGAPAEAAAGCTYAAHSYAAGAEFTAEDGCNTCSCTATGEVTCSERVCTPPVSDASETDESSDANAPVAACHGIAYDDLKAALIDAGFYCEGSRIEYERPSDAGATVPCEYGNLQPRGNPLLSPPFPTQARFWLVYPDGHQEAFQYVASPAECDGPNGGYYVDDPNNPKRLILCPCTCEQFNLIGVMPQFEFACEPL
jgi:hypothetical protein